MSDMSLPNRDVPNHPATDLPPDESAVPALRSTAAALGLLLIGTGAIMAAWMFYQVAQALVDPRPYGPQVDRWEFVIRGKQVDGDPGAGEITDRRGARPTAARPAASDDLSQGIRDVETAASLAGRIGSKAARPTAIFVILTLLLLLVQIARVLIEGGARLIGVASGDRDLMKRLLDALNRKR